MNIETQRIIQEINSSKSLSLHSLSTRLLLDVVIHAVDNPIYWEDAGYIALREICGRNNIPIPILIFMHCLAQWVSCAAISELDGCFLEEARQLEPSNKQVLYRCLATHPNIDGEIDQRQFEIKVVGQILDCYPDDHVALEALEILSKTTSCLPSDFPKKIPNPLEDKIYVKYLLNELRQCSES